MHGLLGALGGTLDAQAVARLVEWYAAALGLFLPHHVPSGV